MPVLEDGVHQGGEAARGAELRVGAGGEERGDRLRVLPAGGEHERGHRRAVGARVDGRARRQQQVDRHGIPGIGGEREGAHARGTDLREVGLRQRAPPRSPRRSPSRRTSSKARAGGIVALLGGDLRPGRRFAAHDRGREPGLERCSLLPRAPGAPRGAPPTRSRARNAPGRAARCRAAGGDGGTRPRSRPPLRESAPRATALRPRRPARRASWRSRAPPPATGGPPGRPGARRSRRRQTRPAPRRSEGRCARAPPRASLARSRPRSDRPASPGRRPRPQRAARGASAERGLVAPYSFAPAALSMATTSS